MNQPWTSDAILELSRTYQNAAILAAAAELHLFDALAAKPLLASDAAASLQCDLRGITILLDALAVMGLLHKQADRYALATGIADVLTTTGSRSVLAMVQHQANCLRNWAQLAATVKLGHLPDRLPSIRGRDADYASFIEAMDNVSGPVAASLIAKLPIPDFRHLLDIGGASGTWTIALLRARPQARATLFDLPQVIPMADRRLSSAGLRDRVTLAPGDFYADPLPRGADLVWLSAIVHQNSRQQNRDLFRKIFDAMAPASQLWIRDFVMADSRTQPPAGAFFAVNMLANTPQGGTFTLAEFHEDLTSAGFTRIQLLHSEPTMNAVVSAIKP